MNLSQTTEKKNSIQACLLLATGVFLIYLSLLPPGIRSIDSNSMIDVAESLATTGSLTVPDSSPLAVLAPNGQHYSPYYPLISVLAVPFVWLGLTAGHLLRLPPHYTAIIFSLIVSILIATGTAALVVLIGLRLGATTRNALTAGLVYAFGTVALPYSRKFFADPLLGLLISLVTFLLLKPTSVNVALASLGCGAAVAAKPAGLLLGLVSAAYLTFRKQRVWQVVSLLIGTCGGWALVLAYNYIRTGNPLNFLQPPGLALGNLLAGFCGLFLSPGHGLVWYCPAAILAIAGARRALQSKKPEALLLIGLSLSLILLHSLWARWDSGLDWGPRFLLPVLPLLMSFTSLLEKRWLKGLLVLGLAGLVINLPTLFVFPERYFLQSLDKNVPLKDLIWSPAHAPLIQIWPCAFEQIQDALVFDPRQMLIHARAHDQEALKKDSLKIVSVWWWLLPAVNVPRWVGALLSLFATAAGIWIILKAYRL